MMYKPLIVDYRQTFHGNREIDGISGSGSL